MPDPAPRMLKVIFTWVCQQCGWANDNNPGACRRCGGDEDDRGRVLVRADAEKIRTFDLVAKIRRDADA